MRTAIACNLDALTRAERERRSSLAARIANGIAETHETGVGYRFELKREPSLYRDALDLISLERRCCALLQMNLCFSPADGPVYLEIGGRGDVKAFLASSGLLDCAR